MDSTIEMCAALLKSRGWEVGIMAQIHNGRTPYVVVANRGQNWIVGEAASQLEAWQHAVRKLV